MSINTSITQYSDNIQSYSRSVQSSKKYSLAYLLIALFGTVIIVSLFIFQIATRVVGKWQHMISHYARIKFGSVISILSMCFSSCLLALVYLQDKTKNIAVNQSNVLEEKKSQLELRVGITQPTLKSDFLSQIQNNDSFFETLISYDTKLEKMNNEITNSLNEVAQCNLDEVPSFITSFNVLSMNDTPLSELSIIMNNYVRNSKEIDDLQKTINQFFLTKTTLSDQLQFIYDVYSGIGFMGSPGASVYQFTEYFLAQDPKLFSKQIAKIQGVIDKVQIGSDNYFSKISNLLLLLYSQKVNDDPVAKISAIATGNTASVRAVSNIMSLAGCSNLTDFSNFIANLFWYIKAVGWDLSIQSVSDRMNTNYIIRNFTFDLQQLSGQSIENMCTSVTYGLGIMNSNFCQMSSNNNNLVNDLKWVQNNVYNIEGDRALASIFSEAGCSSIEGYGGLLRNTKDALILEYLKDMMEYLVNLSNKRQVYYNAVTNWNLSATPDQIASFQKYNPSISSLYGMRDWLDSLYIAARPNSEAYELYIDTHCQLYSDALVKFFTEIKKIVGGDKYSEISSKFSEKIQNITSFVNQYNISDSPASSLKNICSSINLQNGYKNQDSMINGIPLTSALSSKISEYGNFLSNNPIFRSQLAINLGFQRSIDIDQFLSDVGTAWNLTNNGDKSLANFSVYLPFLFSSKSKLLTALGLDSRSSPSALDDKAQILCKYCDWIDQGDEVQKAFSFLPGKVAILKSLPYAAGYNTSNTSNATMLLTKMPQFTNILASLSSLLEAYTRSNGMQMLQKSNYFQNSNDPLQCPKVLNQDFQLSGDERVDFLREFSKNGNLTSSELYRWVAADFLSEMVGQSPHTYIMDSINKKSFQLLYYLKNDQYIQKIFGKNDSNLSPAVLSEISNLLDYTCLAAFYGANTEFLSLNGPDNINPMLSALNTLKGTYPSAYDIYPSQYAILSDSSSQKYSIFNSRSGFNFLYYNQNTYKIEPIKSLSQYTPTGALLARKYSLASYSNLFTFLNPENQQKMIGLLFR